MTASSDSESLPCSLECVFLGVFDKSDDLSRVLGSTLGYLLEACIHLVVSLGPLFLSNLVDSVVFESICLSNLILADF